MAPSMKRIAVFGSTGQTGLCCLHAAVKKGLETTAFVRDPEKIPEELKGKVKIVQGDVLNTQDVAKCLEGQDGVVVALGTRNDTSPTTDLSTGLQNILNEMEKAHIKRVSVCISAFLFWERSKVPSVFQALTEDHDRMLQYLKASNREWIAVLPPHIADEPGTNGKYQVEHGKGPGRVISKWDLGEFLVQSLSADEHIHQECGICRP
ncbi:unnamed protein product [Darwinula stevensoni]|uniref:NAD(P)-binding domain-containing protein n=1 Tax=Darwinula stevensoni TaxID=69355 RepID=A0A7R8ZZR5_9CRUS|nr:unnamed protein product [Darwinula stevensoni]CAG0879361.1 unnamed protein product [Darwinula stevensoni]